MQADFNIAYICDEDYAFTTIISIRSLKQNRKRDLRYRVYIVTKGLSDKSIRSVLELQEKNNFIISICKSRIENEELFEQCRHVSTAALLKFALPSILDDLDCILYADSDILFRKGFEKIFDININDVYAAVVKDMPTYESDHLQELGLCEYFNSGIMYLNLKRMREDDVERKLLEYKKNEKIHLFMDQDAFNVVMGQNVIFIHPQYNLIYDIYRKYDCKQIALFYGISEKRAIDLDQSAYVLHMAGARKPWNDLESEQLYEWLFYMKNFEEYSRWEKELYCDKKSMRHLEDQLHSAERELAQLKEQFQLVQENQSELQQKLGQCLNLEQHQVLEQRVNSLENWIVIRMYKFLSRFLRNK